MHIGRSPTRFVLFPKALYVCAVPADIFVLTKPTTMSSVSDYPAQPARRRGVTFGLVLIIIGAIILLKSLGAIAPFDVDLGFPFIMIAIGVVVGLRSRFRSPAWVILVLIGVANAIPEFRIGRMESDEVAVAIAFIFLGAYVMRRRRWQTTPADVLPDWRQPSFGGEGSAAGFRPGYGGTQAGAPYVGEGPRTINTFALFSGRKEIITSKDFRGGRVASVFGGTQLNLMNADSTMQHIVLDVTAALGGVEIVIPSHWELVNEIDAIFGGVDDARMMRTQPTESSRTLVIRGFCLMGGVEIKSY